MKQKPTCLDCRSSYPLQCGEHLSDPNLEDLGPMIPIQEAPKASEPPTDAAYLRAYPVDPGNMRAPHQSPDPARLRMAIYLSQATFGQATNPGKWESYDLNRKDFWNYVAHKALEAYGIPPKGSDADLALTGRMRTALIEIIRCFDAESRGCVAIFQNDNGLKYWKAFGHAIADARALVDGRQTGATPAVNQ